MNISTLRLEREEEVFYLLIGILVLWVISIVTSRKINGLDSDAN